MTDRSVLKINSVSVGGVPSANIVSVRYKNMLKDKVRFTPNTTSGLAMRNFSKYHSCRIRYDSVTTIFDAYRDEDGVNTAMPVIVIAFLVKNMTTGLQEVETWTFQAGMSYITDQGEARVDRYEERRPWDIEFACIGTRAIAFS